MASFSFSSSRYPSSSTTPATIYPAYSSALVPAAATYVPPSCLATSANTPTLLLAAGGARMSETPLWHAKHQVNTAKFEFEFPNSSHDSMCLI